METEEEFFLENDIEENEFFLSDSTNFSGILENKGADEEFFLGSPSAAEKNEEVKEFSQEENLNSDEKELLEVYTLLKIDEKINEIRSKITYEYYFKDNPEIFKIAGTGYFKTLSEKEFNNFEKKCEKLIAIAHKKWIKIENQRKLEELQDALNALKTIFRSPAKTEVYIKEIKRTLGKQINVQLQQKLKDNILEVSEIQDLMEMAISIKYIENTEKEKLDFLNKIKKLIENNNNLKLESFEETFVRLVSNKNKIERINTDNVRSSLFKEYKQLNSINNYILSNKKNQSDQKLFENMCHLLNNNNLLISNIELFLTDFLEAEIAKKGEFYFSFPLTNDYYYYLKGTAVNKYELTEDQWRELTMIRNIHNESDFTVAFIMGYKKESSVAGISKMLKENPETSVNRILAGDLETYFTHIGRKNIANKISKLKEAYKSNLGELVTGVVNLLNAEIGNSSVENTFTPGIEKISLETLLKKEAELKEIVFFVVKNKENEALFSEITEEAEIIEKIQNVLFSKEKKYSYIKFLFNVLNELLLEADISQYKYAFIKVAEKIQNILSINEDAITYEGTFVPIIEKACELGIIGSLEEISGYSSIKNSMKQKFDEEAEKAKLSEIKKSSFGLFKKRSK